MLPKVKVELCDAISNRLVWARGLADDLSLASFLDNGTLPESDFLHCLSENELLQAVKRQVAEERRHFVIRRCFQRFFVATVIDWQESLQTMRLDHELDSPPRCSDAPKLHLSFSSSGNMYLAAASIAQPVGIDIERKRDVENVLGVAQRFFSTEEAAHLAKLPANDRSSHFLVMWTAKEAGLKAIGKGIVSGMNTFTVKSSGLGLNYTLKDAPGSPADWAFGDVDFLEGYRISIVQRICGEPLRLA